MQKNLNGKINRRRVLMLLLAAVTAPIATRMPFAPNPACGHVIDGWILRASDVDHVAHAL